MAELPVLPIKTDALISDTTHMTAEEMGVYVRLLVAMWRHGAQLPDNPRELARIGGVSLRRWNQITERVMRPMTVREGIISQKRLTSTWLEVQKLREVRVTAAVKRWGNSHAIKHTKQ